MFNLVQTVELVSVYKNKSREIQCYNGVVVVVFFPFFSYSMKCESDSVFYHLCSRLTIFNHFINLLQFYL
ncbi:hypothetical protein DERF_014929 [Dermatophagoides farinae]|uniref:Uncharacterized protein n=1 Tax=Dermatophagoides farinae TaxID=6954 RepID=A0A922HK38_DERFA|nr:hypothetical protein DERF_014929 [Dermatophagoides farinae]